MRTDQRGVARRDEAFLLRPVDHVESYAVLHAARQQSHHQAPTERVPQVSNTPLHAVQHRTHLLQGSMLSNLHAILAKHRSFTRFKYTCSVESTVVEMLQSGAA